MSSRLHKVFLIVFWISVPVNYTAGFFPEINSMFRPGGSAFPTKGGLEPTLVESIASGAQLAMDQCREIFKWDKWNCPQSTFSRQSQQTPTKETAYAEAIISAGLVYSITKNCSKGEISGCGCSKKLTADHLAATKKNWAWGGCSDDVTFAEEIAMKFLLQQEKNAADAQSYIRKHNGFIGRQVIRETLVKKCRCHGVSGSCSLQTCWLQMAPFEEIAETLKQRYEDAVRISFNNGNGDVVLDGNNSSRHNNHSETSTQPATKLNNLMYLVESPNYCLANNTTGWSGTRGRTCLRTNLKNTEKSSEHHQQNKNSCRDLCRSCGHKVRKQKRKHSYRCNCKFMWCCEVKCDICVEDVNEHYCD